MATEKTFSVEEVQALVRLADNLQNEDIVRRELKARSRLDLLPGLSEGNKEALGLKSIERIVQELDIRREYLEQAMKLKYISPEEQQKDAEKYGAELSIEFLRTEKNRIHKQALERGIQRVHQDLATLQLFDYIKLKQKKNMYEGRGERKFMFSGINLSPRRLSFLFGKKKNKTLLLDLEACVTNCIVDLCWIHVYHPLFLRACGETIQEMKKYLPIEVKLDYNPGESK